MFCPECGKELPYTEAIRTVRGNRPIYDHDCHHPAIKVWVYDNEKTAYIRFPSRQAAVRAYDKILVRSAEDDIVKVDS